MSYVIVFYMLDGFYGQWSTKEVLGPVESLDIAEQKLMKWGYSKQEGYQLGDVKNVWLIVREHTENVPKNQPQYFIRKAEVYEIKSC